MDHNIVEGKWKELKGMVREQWGNLTEDEIDRTHGNLDQLAGRLQAKYGFKVDEARSKLNDMLGKINQKL